MHSPQILMLHDVTRKRHQELSNHPENLLATHNDIVSAVAVHHWISRILLLQLVNMWLVLNMK